MHPSDLPERLEDRTRGLVRSDREEAAHYIRLLQAALKPFAEAADRASRFGTPHPEAQLMATVNGQLFWEILKVWRPGAGPDEHLRVADLHAARVALAGGAEMP